MTLVTLVTKYHIKFTHNSA